MEKDFPWVPQTLKKRTKYKTFLSSVEEWAIPTVLTLMKRGMIYKQNVCNLSSNS